MNKLETLIRLREAYMNDELGSRFKYKDSKGKPCAVGYLLPPSILDAIASDERINVSPVTAKEVIVLLPKELQGEVLFLNRMQEAFDEKENFRAWVEEEIEKLEYDPA